MYSQMFAGNYCRKTIEDTTVKKVPNERKLFTQYTILLKLLGVSCFRIVAI